jgi:hypothetical protein
MMLARADLLLMQAATQVACGSLARQGVMTGVAWQQDYKHYFCRYTRSVIFSKKQAV